MNKYMNMFVSTMNNICTMYLHYVEQRLEGQDKFERSNIN